MLKFIAGAACVVLIQFIGWNTLVNAVSRANDAARAAYTQAEAQTAPLRNRGGK